MECDANAMNMALDRINDDNRKITTYRLHSFKNDIIRLKLKAKITNHNSSWDLKP